jgi:hypothetical protein
MKETDIVAKQAAKHVNYVKQFLGYIQESYPPAASYPC